jgi:hypothetical protein
MRGAWFVALCISVLVLTAWTSGSAPQPPRQCSNLDSKQQKTLNVSSAGSPVYIRFCGPAHALVRVNGGRPFRVLGGHCFRRPSDQPDEVNRHFLSGIAVGLITNPPARPGLGVSFFWVPPSTHADRVTIDDSEIEVPGRRVAASGTVIVGPKLNGGTFRLYGRTSAGSTGVRVAGSWTCG